MKRSITIVLIIVLLVNTLFPNFIYAEGYGTYQDAQEHQQDGANINDKLWNDAEAEVKSDTSERNETVNDTKTSSNMVANVLCWVITLFPQCVNSILTLIVYNTQEGVNSTTLGALDKAEILDKKFTIEDLVFGRYTLFDIDYFNFTNSTNNNHMNSVLKTSIAEWYFALRLLAMAISLLVLIYVGIRMAISTLASDKAKYKKMLTGWFASFVLLFVMHYIVIFLIEMQEVLLRILDSWAQDTGFEEDIIGSIWKTLESSFGFNNIWAVIEYFMLVYYQVKFFLVYYKRNLEVGFLMIIGPLVTVTYPIDKVGDGKAQAYGTWLSKLIYNIFLQVIHALAYIVFIYSAAEIAKRAPIVAILFLSTLSRLEKIIKTTFGLSGKGIAESRLLDKIKRG